MNEQLKQHILGKDKHYCTFKLAEEALAAANKETQTIPMTFAAPYYVERYYGYLILNFEKEAVDLSRWSKGAPFLFNHNDDDQRGIVLNGELKDKTLFGNVKFSQTQAGKDLFMDIVDGIRPYTSVGFKVLEVHEMTEEEMPDDLKSLCLANQCPAFFADKWGPFEGTSATLAANPNVGVQYDFFDGDDEKDIPDLAEKFGIEKYKKQIEVKPTITIKKEDGMSDPVKKTPEQLAQEKKERKATLLEWGKDYEKRVAGGMPFIGQLADDVLAAFSDRETAEIESLFRGEVFTNVRDKARLENPASFVDLNEKEKERYSVMNVIRFLTGESKELGFEQEIHDQIIKNGGQTQKGGILLPMDLQSRKINYNAELEYLLAKNGIRTERFDQTAGTTTAGGYLVGTQHRPQDFIDIYLNSLIQGFTYLPGLSQNVDIPKMTGGATITVAATEAAGFSETALTFGQLLLQPKELGAYIEITRKLRVQSSPAIDNLVTTMLMKALALKTNYLALYGSGASGEPTGAFLTSNIGTFDGTGIGRSGVLNAMADIRSSNVVGKLEWLLSAATAETLMGRDQTSGYGKWLMDDDGKILNYTSQVTEQMAANTLALAKLDEIIVASFGQMELNHDTATLSASGGLRIAIYDFIDAGVKHPGAISYASSVS